MEIEKCFYCDSELTLNELEQNKFRNIAKCFYCQKLDLVKKENRLKSFFINDYTKFVLFCLAFLLALFFIVYSFSYLIDRTQIKKIDKHQPAKDTLQVQVQRLQKELLKLEASLKFQLQKIDSTNKAYTNQQIKNINEKQRIKNNLLVNPGFRDHFRDSVKRANNMFR